jgi:hypothetical protein
MKCSKVLARGAEHRARPLLPGLHSRCGRSHKNVYGLACIRPTGLGLAALERVQTLPDRYMGFDVRGLSAQEGTSERLF